MIKQLRLWDTYIANIYTLYTDTRLSTLIECTVNDSRDNSLYIWNKVLNELWRNVSIVTLLVIYWYNRYLWWKMWKTSTTHAAFPPNSSTTFFFPAFCFISHPTCKIYVQSSWRFIFPCVGRKLQRCMQIHTLGDPVNVTSLNRSSTVKSSAPSLVQGRMENVPSGSRHRDNISPSSKEPIGVRLEK